MIDFQVVGPLEINVQLLGAFGDTSNLYEKYCQELVTSRRRSTQNTQVDKLL